jgi:ABC-type phosphate transport system substrate-binding protein
MPANDGRHHCTTHRTRTGTLSARAAIIALVLAACTATTSSTSALPQSVPGATAAAASSPDATLTGAGSTFDAPFFDLAFAKYHQQHPA